ncbi:hypothetical protein SprV_0902761900 [Sparganum proliferum]
MSHGRIAELLISPQENLAKINKGGRISVAENVIAPTYMNANISFESGDCIFTIVKLDMLQHFHGLLNTIIPDVKFPEEEKQEQQVPFLDVLVKRNLNGELETTVYGKPTNTTHLSFHSNHPVAHKRSWVKTVFKRIQKHYSEPEDRAREARYLGDHLVQKDYSGAFISRCLSGRPQRTQTTTPPTIWHSLTYIKGVSEATGHIATELQSHHVQQGHENIRLVKA